MSYSQHPMLRAAMLRKQLRQKQAMKELLARIAELSKPDCVIGLAEAKRRLKAIHLLTMENKK